MTESDFLNKLKLEQKISLVEPSLEICQSYIIKADNCLKSSKILFKAQLYENSVGEAYFGMYNSVLALLFKVGIKSETHAGSIILIRKIFSLNSIEKSLLIAKKERIDKQYYVTDTFNLELNEDSAMSFIKRAESTILELKSYINNLNTEKIIILRKKFKNME